MSSAVNNLGTFDPNQYKNNGTGSRPTQRMAGDYLSEFANQNANDKKDENTSFSYQGNNGKSYGTNTEKMLFGNSKSKDTNVNSTVNEAPAAAQQQEQPQASTTPPASQSGGGWTDSSGKAYKGKPSAAAVSPNDQQAQANLANRTAELTASYDPDQYRYYDSDFGTGTGHEAYAQDMANYETWVERNNSGPTAGHLGLVASMMHPNWGRSQRAGGGAEDPEAQDYATRPQFAAGSKAGVVFERKFGSGGASNDQSKQYSSNSSSSSSSSNGKLNQTNRSRGGWQ